MPIRPNLPVGPTTTTPPAAETYSKFVLVSRADTTAFQAVVVPHNAVINFVRVNGQAVSDSATSASISIGSNPGTTNEVLAAYDVKAATGKGNYLAGAFAGTQVGVANTTGQAGSIYDQLYLAKYSETGASTVGGPWLIEVGYYYPQQGNFY